MLEITVPQSDLESEQEGLGGEPEDRNSCSGSSGAAFKQLASAREAPEGAFDEGRLVFTMRPVYPLVKKLERPWPVQV